MLKVENLSYDSWATIYFQRGSVIVTEVLLAFALHMFVLSISGNASPVAHEFLDTSRLHQHPRAELPIP